MSTISDSANRAREASQVLASIESETKDAVLRTLARLIRAQSALILGANTGDMDAARESGLDAPKLARLELTEAGLEQMCRGLEQIAAMEDPVGMVTTERVVESGLKVQKVRSPLGVIAMIYEARPGVTIDAFALCFKAGNACLLKGGREAAHSNAALAELAKRALGENGAPESAIELVTTSDREEIKEMLGLTGVIDLVIPRGGARLIEFVHEHARVPTIQHFHGVCHAFVHASADLEKALAICTTGTTSAPATCNSLECVLVDAAIADEFLPRLGAACGRDGIELRGDSRTVQLAPGAVAAAEDDWGTEFLDKIIACRVIDGLDGAIEHIQQFGSDHTETIVAQDEEVCERFARRVTSSCVLTNASTRFNDGFQLGLGAEIGISTSRIHAYGPMGLAELTIERYIVRGDGQVR
ncbi:MAG: glutamate-5-semialdehyde dehydrogenase [Phycisphaera sp.]|nr:MAG: glutamate-5-semialdehyde dehydrogenase [Phycisphaera sp.]